MIKIAKILSILGITFSVVSSIIFQIDNSLAEEPV